jgi:hypothetical protein
MRHLISGFHKPWSKLVNHVEGQLKAELYIFAGISENIFN